MSLKHHIKDNDEECLHGDAEVDGIAMLSKISFPAAAAISLDLNSEAKI